MKLIVIVILQSWAVASSADSCMYPKYAVSTSRTVEVYQMTHILNTTLNETTVKVDLIRNLVTLPSGTVCLYNVGNCYDSKDRLTYYWDIPKSFPEGDLMCRNLMRLYTDEEDFRYTYQVLTLKTDPLVQFLVAESAVSLLSLHLIKEETFCGKTVWRTDQSELVVAVGEENFINTSYEFMDPFLDKPTTSTGAYPIRRKEDIYSAMMIKCELYSHIMEYKEKINDTRIEEITRSKFNVADNYKEEINQLKDNISSIENDLRSRNLEFDKLRDEIDNINVAMKAMQNEIAKYKNENDQLKKSLKSIRKKLMLVKSEPVRPKEDFSETENLDEVDPTLRKNNNTVQKESMFGLSRFINGLNTSENCQNFVLFPYDNLLCVFAAVSYVTFAVFNTITNYFSLRLLRNKKQKRFVFYTLTQGLTTRYICRNQSLTKNKLDKWLLDLE